MKYLNKIKKEFSEEIADICVDDDGIWIYLKAGFKSTHMECGTIHEETYKKCYEVLKVGIEKEI